MGKLQTLNLIVAVLALAFASFHVAKGQETTENVKTFFDITVSGLNVQVNATAETRPTQNITVVLCLKGLTDVHVEKFNMSIYGFLHGKTKTLMINMTDNDLSLNNTRKDYNCTFTVPENVWDVTSGEIRLTYTAKLWGVELTFRDLALGFTMTYVENVYLKSVEEQLTNLNATYWELNSTYGQLNQTYWDLYKNHTDLEGSLNELDNTRRLAIILGITTISFVATTFYLIMRRPKEPW